MMSRQGQSQGPELLGNMKNWLVWNLEGLCRQCQASQPLGCEAVGLQMWLSALVLPGTCSFSSHCLSPLSTCSVPSTSLLLLWRFMQVRQAAPLWCREALNLHPELTTGSHQVLESSSLWVGWA